MHLHRAFLWIAISIPVLIPFATFAHVLESFTITTRHVQIREFTQSSIQLQSDTFAYTIKLEPNRAGQVIFSLSGIGYASTVKLSNLRFGVKITGYRDAEAVYPTFSFDDINKDIIVENNMLIFQRIYGALPVWFNGQVDSISLQFSNSLSVNVAQYLGIQDLRIVPPIDIAPNPSLTPCSGTDMMIAIDGSSSIDKNERTFISKKLLEFVKRSGITQDSTELCILEFGSDVLSSFASTEKSELVGAVRNYKRDRNDKSKYICWTNWSSAFDAAIEKQPDLFIFITDGWSNWQGEQPSSFSAQYESLIARSNTLKANGTRLLIVTSDIDTPHNSLGVLSSFLNGDMTWEVRERMLSAQTDLSQVDLITLQSFAAMPLLNMSSLIVQCPPEQPEGMLTAAPCAISHGEIREMESLIR